MAMMRAMMRWAAVMVGLVACREAPRLGPEPDAGTTMPDAASGPRIVITSTVGSTRSVTREQMLAAGEMQISGEPLAEAMGRDLGAYSRDFVPPDVYQDTSLGILWDDIPGFSSGIESYEYSKQPMNNLAFESGAGTALAFGPVLNPAGVSGEAAHDLLAGA